MHPPLCGYVRGGNSVRSAPFRMFEAEFGADGEPVPDGGQCFSRQFFIDEWPIGFCGVEKRDAMFDSLTDQPGHGFSVRVYATVVIHFHTAESESGYGQFFPVPSVRFPDNTGHLK